MNALSGYALDKDENAAANADQMGNLMEDENPVVGSSASEGGAMDQHLGDLLDQPAGKKRRVVEPEENGVFVIPTLLQSALGQVDEWPTRGIVRIILDDEPTLDALKALHKTGLALDRASVPPPGSSKHYNKEKTWLSFDLDPYLLCDGDGCKAEVPMSSTKHVVVPPGNWYCDSCVAVRAQVPSGTADMVEGGEGGDAEGMLIDATNDTFTAAIDCAYELQALGEAVLGVIGRHLSNSVLEERWPCTRSIQPQLLAHGPDAQAGSMPSCVFGQDKLTLCNFGSAGPVNTTDAAGAAGKRRPYRRVPPASHEEHADASLLSLHYSPCHPEGLAATQLRVHGNSNHNIGSVSHADNEIIVYCGAALEHACAALVHEERRCAFVRSLESAEYKAFSKRRVREMAEAIREARTSRGTLQVEVDTQTKVLAEKRLEHEQMQRERAQGVITERERALVQAVADTESKVEAARKELVAADAADAAEAATAATAATAVSEMAPPFTPLLPAPVDLSAPSQVLPTSMPANDMCVRVKGGYTCLLCLTNKAKQRVFASDQAIQSHVSAVHRVKIEGLECPRRSSTKHLPASRFAASSTLTRKLSASRHLACTTKELAEARAAVVSLQEGTKSAEAVRQAESRIAHLERQIGICEMRADRVKARLDAMTTGDRRGQKTWWRRCFALHDCTEEKKKYEDEESEDEESEDEDKMEKDLYDDNQTDCDRILRPTNPLLTSIRPLAHDEPRTSVLYRLRGHGHHLVRCFMLLGQRAPKVNEAGLLQGEEVGDCRDGDTGCCTLEDFYEKRASGYRTHFNLHDFRKSSDEEDEEDEEAETSAAGGGRPGVAASSAAVTAPAALASSVNDMGAVAALSPSPDSAGGEGEEEGEEEGGGEDEGEPMQQQEADDRDGRDTTTTGKRKAE